MSIHHESSDVYVRHAFSGKTQGQYALKALTPSMTKQQFKDECDINVIMAQYQQTGIIDFLNKHEPQYIDCTGFDFDQAQYTVAQAQSLFNDLPSSIRARFENQPSAFLNFVQDENNRGEAEKLGLVRPRPAPAAPAPAASASPEPAKNAPAA
jgi:phage internal scaffolding protein